MTIKRVNPTMYEEFSIGSVRRWIHRGILNTYIEYHTGSWSHHQRKLWNV